MQRDARAYLNDIVEACLAIERAVSGLDLVSYRTNRLVRSAVEREFIIVGEAVSTLGRLSPGTYSRITNARRIVDFRNQLTHAYPTVDDAIGWLIAEHDVPILRQECSALLEVLGDEGQRTLIANEPLNLSGHELGQTVTVARDRVSDWMYVSDGVLRGGYTIRLLRDRLTEHERAESDQSVGFLIE